MKSISITIEKLSNGMVRATGRVFGRTVSSKDGLPEHSKSIVSDVMSETCYAHKANGVYDMAHIEFNDAARLAME